MKIVILTFGTRGEVQPLVSLALGLQSAGHKTQFITQSIFSEFVRQYGLECVGISLDLRAAQKERRKDGHFPFLGLVKVALDHAQRDLACIWEASQDADALIACGVGVTPAWHLAEKLSVPLFAVFLYPVDVCHALARTGFVATIRSDLTRLMNAVLSKGVFRYFLNMWRKKSLGLPPAAYGIINEIDLNRAQVPIFYAFSPIVFPKLATWPDSNYVTGYWFLDQSKTWAPPPALREFLDAGSPPIYVGFSSAEDRAVRNLDTVILDALQLARQRGLLTAGWSDLGRDLDLPETVMRLPSVPHDWLFPQVAAALHHGGAGTTATAFRAGIPNIIMPVGFDTPLWAKRNAELGVGPPGLFPEKLTAVQLAEAISSTVGDDKMHEKRISLRKKLMAEDGVTRAMDIFHQYVR